MAKRYPLVYSTVDMQDHPTIERAVSQPKRTKTKPPGNAASSNGCIRVVAADDSAHLRTLMGYIFNNAVGYTVRLAEDGEDAWTSLCAEPFDLLITDFNMPRLNGLELVGRMRSHSFRQPVIFVSGSLPSDAPGLFESLSPCEGLGKPFSVRELLAKAEAMTHCHAPNGTNGSSRNGTNGSSRNGTNGHSHTAERIVREHIHAMGSHNGTNGHSHTV